MLAQLEGNYRRELRFDFRTFYHTSYDDVPTDEAIDLITMLPNGSKWRIAQGDIEATWDNLQYRIADIEDAILAHAWVLKGAPTPEPTHVMRPLDSLKLSEARQKANKVKQTINETKWEEV